MQGFSYGAQNIIRLNKAIKVSIIWSTIFCVLYGGVMTIFSTPITLRFSESTEMITIASNSLKINGITFILFGFYTVYSSLFLALGKGKEGFILGACRQGLCFVPVILIAPMLCGLNGIMYSQPIADILSAIITIFMAINLHKSLKSENNLDAKVKER